MFLIDIDRFMELEERVCHSAADSVLLAPLYAAGEAPIAGINSQALADRLQHLRPELPLAVSTSLDKLAEQVVRRSRPGDLVLVMGAGDVNGLWSRLEGLADLSSPDAPDTPAARLAA